MYLFYTQGISETNSRLLGELFGNVETVRSGNVAVKINLAIIFLLPVK